MGITAISLSLNFPLSQLKKTTGKYTTKVILWTCSYIQGGKKKTFIPGLDKTCGDCQSKTHTEIHTLQLGIYIFSVSEQSKDTGPNA